MRFKKSVLLLPVLAILLPLHAQQEFAIDLESLRQRDLPSWYSDAKFGIFIHWGVYSVPAFREPLWEKEGTYAEWYAPDVMYKPWRNDSVHARLFGKDFEYRDFGPLFKAELWDPVGWAELFEASGAKYVVLTAKHHDGFCLWDTKDPHSAGWNSVTTGPGRDIVEELSSAVRSKRMKFGVYYSLLEWETTKTGWPHDERLAGERTGYYVPKAIWDRYHIDESVFVNHLHFQLKELTENYNPDLIFADGAWDHPHSYWRSAEFLEWLYNDSPVKRNVVVNDRWGNDAAGQLGDYLSLEYGKGALPEDRAWEDCMGMGYSFGFNRAEQLEDIKSSGELIAHLCRTVSAGGNLLLNVGPTADGRIPLIQQQRLMDIGNWLGVNGKAIYKTKPYPIPSDRFTFTRNGSNIYAFLYEWTQGSIKISLPEDLKIKNCILLGHDKKIVWKMQGPDLLIIPPVISPENQQVRHVYVFQVTLDQN